MIGRLPHKRDFERLLAMPPCLRSAHFAVHHVHASPSVAPAARHRAAERALSTDDSLNLPLPVDNSVAGHWLGCVVPKRHAPHAVTRNMVRRQVRARMLQHQSRLPTGLWLVRLRRPFAASQYPSADSSALRRQVADELERLLSRPPA